MHKEKSDGAIEADELPVALSASRSLRLISVHGANKPQRRRAPRRQVVVNVMFDRRRNDRRLRQPGIDGLLRTVLSDNWP